MSVWIMLLTQPVMALVLTERQRDGQSESLAVLAVTQYLHPESTDTTQRLVANVGAEFVTSVPRAARQRVYMQVRACELWPHTHPAGNTPAESPRSQQSSSLYSVSHPPCLSALCLILCVSVLAPVHSVSHSVSTVSQLLNGLTRYDSQSL